MLTLLAAMAMAKPNTAHIIEESWKKTLVVGHRGAAAYAPENTLPAFEQGIESGAVAVECDVHLSRDGEMIVMHDGTLDRTTSLEGKVKETDAATMRAAGIPTLADLTKVTKDRTVLIVEIKDGDGVEKKVVDHLTAEQMRDQSIVFSFGRERVKRVKELDSGLFGVWLVAVVPPPAQFDSLFDQLKDAHADAFGVQYKNATPELIQEAHRRKIPVFVWTVPPGGEVDRLKGLRANFIITDHPRDVVAQLGR